MIVDNKGRKIIIGKNVPIMNEPATPEKQYPKVILHEIAQIISEGGYNPVSQIAGYIISEDPAHISNYKNARTLMSKIDRDELLEDIIRVYLDHIDLICTEEND